MAHDEHYEIHEDGILGHSPACNDRQAYRDDIHCPDDGRCSHPASCLPRVACWRVLNADPLSITGWRHWPREIKEDPKPLDGPNAAHMNDRRPR